MGASFIVLAYLSPETVLPVTSIVAAIAGAAMFLTRGATRFVAGCFLSALGRPHQAAGASDSSPDSSDAFPDEARVE